MPPIRSDSVGLSIRLSRLLPWAVPISWTPRSAIVRAAWASSSVPISSITMTNLGNGVRASSGRSAFWSFTWTNLFVAAFLYWVAVGLGISMGYHRLHTHRSYKVPTALEYFFAVCGTLIILALTLALDGKGRYRVRTGIRFLDHMLELFTRHGGFDVKLDARGNVLADENYMSSVPGVFAAGDMRRGQSLVVWAIREGRPCRRASARCRCR